jgi:hypothetical protein
MQKYSLLVCPADFKVLRNKCWIGRMNSRRSSISFFLALKQVGITDMEKVVQSCKT